MFSYLSSFVYPVGEEEEEEGAGSGTLKCLDLKKEKLSEEEFLLLSDSELNKMRILKESKKKIRFEMEEEEEEIPELTLEDALKELKLLIENESEGNELLEGVKENDGFLKTFLAARNNSPEVAFKVIKGHLKVKHEEFPEIFNLSAEDVRHVLESGCVGILRERDSLGRRVIVARVANLDPETMEWVHLVKATSLAIEYFWNELDDVRIGQVVVGDTEGFTFAMYWKYTINQYINFLKIFWYNYPSKIKGLHWVRIPSLAWYLYSCISPFLPEALTKLIHLHNDDFESLHEFVSPDILPYWLGGNLSDEEALDMELVEKFLAEAGTGLQHENDIIASKDEGDEGMEIFKEGFQNIQM